jgi:hypothetical protein
MSNGSDASQAPQEEFTVYFAARFHSARRRAYLLCGDWHRADGWCQSTQRRSTCGNARANHLPGANESRLMRQAVRARRARSSSPRLLPTV